MVSNINIDSDQINTATTTLNKAVGDIPQQLNNLLNAVNNLLGSKEGGLFLSQSSPAFQTAYKNFNDSLVAAVQTIGSFSQQFTSIANSINGMDESIAKSINGK
ncbi:MAG: hypothetical protein HOV87_07475 [Catenulispora sp.]|nr:hypothetical protein [Catenulispora sp.]